MSPGDLVFVRSRGLIGWAIRLAQWFPWRAGCQWNHVAVLDACDPRTGEWSVIQAEARGVTRGAKLSDIAPGGAYEVVPLPPGVTGARVRSFARQQVGRPYGYLTIASILVTLFTPRFVNVLWPGTWTCSALAAESWRYGSWYHDWPDIYQVSPAEFWIALKRPSEVLSGQHAPVGVSCPFVG